MKNIVIFCEEENSYVGSRIQGQEDLSIQVLKPEHIKEVESGTTDLVVLENSTGTTRDILIRNKIPAPLLIVSDQIFTDATVRADAFDYILTPIKDDELKVRVANLLRIKQLKDEIKIVSTTDELTGLYNRTYVHERLEAEISRAKRYGTSVSCMLLDIDFFKVVNDMYGYDWGDVLLKDVTEVLKRHVRKEDILTRYGDEEFLIVLPNTDEDSSYIFAERLRKDIAQMEFKPDGEEERHPITISGGIASYPFLTNVDENANTLIRYSEHALYNAKKRGKNKIVQFSQINLEF